MPKSTPAFASRLLRWWDRHGRKDLPWQRRPTPYRVWVSEIMLQQTQVATVIPYYRRFMRRFPSLKRLAEAPLDEVLAYWSGLGYYARARNLHRAAGTIRTQHHGRFPDRIEDLMALPGIGRSTAGAILALAHDRPQAILDGNVKRLLCRHGAIPGWPGETRVEAQLWRLSASLLPARRGADYTQALMDLGATCCLPRAPDCGHCPLSSDCRARAAGEVERYPQKKPRAALPVRQYIFIIARDGAGRVLLERRPASGIWGGLWCFPEFQGTQAAARRHAREHLGLRISEPRPLPLIRHSFSHFHLHITPLLVHADEIPAKVMEGPQQLWYNLREPPALGLATPVRRLLQTLDETSRP